MICFLLIKAPPVVVSPGPWEPREDDLYCFDQGDNPPPRRRQERVAGQVVGTFAEGMDGAESVAVAWSSSVALSGHSLRRRVLGE